MKGLISLISGSRRAISAAAACTTALVASSVTAADTPAAGAALAWSGWWLPSNHSVHGAAIDTLFLWIFWITMIVFVGVQVALIWFMIKYRWNKDRKKAVFTHGNTRLEMGWTIAPAIILAALAVGSKSVWDEYRYLGNSPDSPEAARVMVIGEQFAWNVIYPGPSNQLGRYLIYPRPTDLRWPAPEGQEVTFAGVPGPAYLSREEAISAINTYINQENRLGKDFVDPAGLDDDWRGAIRPLIIPADRPVEVHVSSRDVIHSFFLPEYRVKLDTVPGMRGIIRFTAISESVEADEKLMRPYQLDELERIVARQRMLVVVGPLDEARGAEFTAVRPRTPRIWRYTDDRGTIVRDGTELNPELLERLRDAGVEEIVAHGVYDIVCAELCGLGHSRMQGSMIVVEPQEYVLRYQTQE